MRTRLLAGLVVVLTALLLTTTPVVAQAAKLITGKNIKDSSVTGKDIKNDSLTGADVKESGLGKVPSAAKADSATTATSAQSATTATTAQSATTANTAGTATTATTAGTADVANGLALLGSGQTQSGTFGFGTGSASGSAGYLGTSINYPRALDAPIANANIIDTEVNPDPVHCAGPGQAAPGYLCLYFLYHSGIDYVYGYSDTAPYSLLPDSIGLALYAEVVDFGEVYADGVWTVTAP